MKKNSMTVRAVAPELSPEETRERKLMTESRDIRSQIQVVVDVDAEINYLRTNKELAKGHLVGMLIQDGATDCFAVDMRKVQRRYW